MLTSFTFPKIYNSFNIEYIFEGGHTCNINKNFNLRANQNIVLYLKKIGKANIERCFSIF